MPASAITRIEFTRSLGRGILRATLYGFLAFPALAETFVQEVAHRYGSEEGLPSLDVREVAGVEGGGVVAWTAEGAVRFSEGRWLEIENAAPPAKALEEWKNWTARDAAGRVWDGQQIRATAVDSLNRRWFACAGGLACETEMGWRFYQGSDGLPYAGFTSAAAGPSGEVWFGTDRGLVRFQEGRFAYRQGQRWLPDDEVRAVAVDEAGDVWVATAQGVGRIEMREMTLLEKAAYYEEEIERYIKRTPYGFVSPVRVAEPGTREGVTRHDNDNDGLWTAMYGASQCFAYAALKEPRYKARAEDAFRALKALQDIPQTGEIRPPAGYVARTLRSTDDPDPNEGRKEADEAMRAERDGLWKTLDPRWPRSGDGRWYWKSDTSSDELDGHFFFYGLYHDLVAETAEERRAVAEVAGKLAAHLVDHGFTLIDHDGRPTRWGRFDPAALNHDPNWEVERGLNSLSMLAYLEVAARLTGDSRFVEASQELQEKHAYATNAMVPKIQRGYGSGNQSDDEMAFMGFYHLIRYTEDARLQSRYANAFRQYWLLEEKERNPFFHFAYAAAVQGVKPHDTPWGAVSMAPGGDWLEDSLETLRGFPLDRADWPHENSHRLDLRSLPESQTRSLELAGPDELFRGYRVDGKVLPVEERHFNHWNTDPWQLNYGGDGRTLACGTVFLLPYYMGVYHGFVEHP